jgi:hypothetical protein
MYKFILYFGSFILGIIVNIIGFPIIKDNKFNGQGFFILILSVIVWVLFMHDINKENDITKL